MGSESIDIVQPTSIDHYPFALRSGVPLDYYRSVYIYRSLSKEARVLSNGK